MKKLAILAMGLFAATAMAEVEMNMGTCVNAGDQIDPKYINKTPDAWDMRGWDATVGGTQLKGAFAAQASGTFFVPPNGQSLVNFAGCGNSKGVPYNKQLEAKIGSCNEPTPPAEPLSMKCTEINTNVANFYNPAQCIKDGLGINRGDGYGGFIDSYRDQTQIQVAIPASTFQMAGQTVKFDPAASMDGGTFYMMGMVALQEYLYVDMQFMLALGASTSGAGLVDANGKSIYVTPANQGNDINPYGSFKVTYQTAVGRLGKDYPKYFPANMATSLVRMVSKDGFEGTGTAANSPQQINSAFLASMNLWWLFDGLKSAQDLCFKQFLKDAKDKSAGLKLMLGGYHIGPNIVDQGTGNDDYATHVLPTTDQAILGAADVTDKMKGFAWDYGPPAGPDHGTRNYITKVFSVLDQLVAANPSSNACGGALNVYDSPITLQQVQQLFYGEGGTAATQGNGGLLWHFQIDPAARTALWTDLICAFDQLKGKAPSTLGTANISYRYDFLTILRVARQYFGGYVNKFTDRPTPADAYSSDYSIWVFNHSQKPCGRSTQDVTWPVMTLADTVYRKGDKLTGTFTDNAGPLKEYAYTSDTQWRQWLPTNADFTIPADLPDNGKLWFRITDSCGNSTIQQVNVKNLPPPPQLPKPIASPAGQNFFNNLNVALTDSLATASIYYTTDGSMPTVGGATTKLFAAGTPVVISGVTTVLKAIAVAPGYRNSEVMMETYTKVAMPVVETPKATPPGQNFSSLSAGVTVTLATATAGATIWYTIDNSAPDSTNPAAKKYVAGTAIAITTTTTIKAMAYKVDNLPSGVMSETYTRVVPPSVATPTATPAGQNFMTPLNVALATTTAGATLYYSTDGNDPDTVANARTFKYTGPIAVSATTTLKAIGLKADLLPSAIMTEKYVFTPPVAVTKAYYLDKDGDGRIETAVVEFEKDLPVAPAKLGFTIKDQAGKTEDRTAANGDITFAAGSKTRLTVTFTEPFGYGVTSVTNRDASGKMFSQSNIPLLDATFPVDDSVPPVVAKATAQQPDSAHPQERIMITLSEAATLPLTSQTALIFKHDGAETGAGQVRIAKVEKTGDRDYVVYIDTASSIYPTPGDFVALANDGSIKDMAGNAPSAKTFRILEGEVPKPKPTTVYVTFPDGQNKKASDGPEPQGDVLFIPIDQGGNALPGNPADGKCAGQCYAGDNGTFVGPVFHIVTPGPLKYKFQIFNNVGEFLAAGEGRFELEDLKKMSSKNDASGMKYVARVIWTGRTSQGRKAGTGAYILQATLTTDKDPRTGAPQSTEKKRVTFGLLRGFKGS